MKAVKHTSQHPTVIRKKAGNIVKLDHNQPTVMLPGVVVTQCPNHVVRQSAVTFSFIHNGKGEPC